MSKPRKQKSMKDNYSSYLGNWRLDSNPLDRAFQTLKHHGPTKAIVRRKKKIKHMPMSPDDGEPSPFERRFYSEETPHRQYPPQPPSLLRRSSSVCGAEQLIPPQVHQNLQEQYTETAYLPPQCNNMQQQNQQNSYGPPIDHNSYHHHQLEPSEYHSYRMVQSPPPFSPRESPQEWVYSHYPPQVPYSSYVEPSYPYYNGSARFDNPSLTEQVSEIMPSRVSNPDATTYCGVAPYPNHAYQDPRYIPSHPQPYLA